LRLEVMTDGTVSPSSALHKAANILKDHFEKIGGAEVKEFEAPKAKKAEGAGEAKKRGRPKKAASAE
jgi:DNA-directed RNA polymerase alpha subunit